MLIYQNQMTDEDHRKTKSEFEARVRFLIGESETFGSKVRGKADAAILHLSDKLHAAN